MKQTSLLIFALMLAALPAAAQEVLENADFSDGTTHWHGDCKPASSDSSTDFTSNTSGSGGLLVELHSSSWIKVTQEIRVNIAPPAATLAITYQVSSDFKLSDRTADYGNIGPLVGFGGAMIQSQLGQITAFIDVLPMSRSSISNNGNLTQVTIFDDHVSAASFAPATEQKSQTITLGLNPPPPTHDSHQTSASPSRPAPAASRSPRFRSCRALGRVDKTALSIITCLVILRARMVIPIRTRSRINRPINKRTQPRRLSAPRIAFSDASSMFSSMAAPKTDGPVPDLISI